MRDGFLFVGALSEWGELVGFAYGWPTQKGEIWNNRLRKELGAEAEEWLTDCFEFVDLAVRESAHGFGLGRNLMVTLLSHVRERNALLLTHSSSTRASAMYLRYGWRILRDSFCVESQTTLAIMVKNLSD